MTVDSPNLKSEVLNVFSFGSFGWYWAYVMERISFAVAHFPATAAANKGVNPGMLWVSQGIRKMFLFSYQVCYKDPTFCHWWNGDIQEMFLVLILIASTFRQETQFLDFGIISCITRFVQLVVIANHVLRDELARIFRCDVQIGSFFSSSSKSSSDS